MGVEFMLASKHSKYYLRVGKRSEWANKLWKIWDFLKNSEGAFFIIRDEDKAYGQILDNPEYHDYEVLLAETRCSDSMRWKVIDLTHGVSMASRRLEGLIEIEGRHETERLEALKKYQEMSNVHELTCANGNCPSHTKLTPTMLHDRAVLQCPNCKLVQIHIPEAVFDIVKSRGGERP